MIKVTCASIRELEPCYDPERYLPETYSAPLHEFLAIAEIPAADRIWVASRLAPDRVSRLFAARCARRALSRVPNPDARSLAAVEAAERAAWEAGAAEAAAGAARAARSEARVEARAAERELQVLDFIEILREEIFKCQPAM